MVVSPSPILFRKSIVAPKMKSQFYENDPPDQYTDALRVAMDNLAQSTNALERFLEEHHGEVPRDYRDFMSLLWGGFGRFDAKRQLNALYAFKDTPTYIIYAGDRLQDAVEDAIRELNRAYEKSIGNYSKKELSDQSKEKHDFGCLMAIVPDPIAQQIIEWTNSQINPEHIRKLSSRPHITIKYGFKDNNPETITKITSMLAVHGPIRIKIGNFTHFPDNGDGDVLILPIESPELNAMNALITEEFDCENKYPDYKPHITVAYLDPRFTDSYEVIERLPFQNVECVCDVAEWSGADGTKVDIPLITPVGEQGSKTMSAYDVTRGGALVGSRPLKRKQKGYLSSIARGALAGGLAGAGITGATLGEIGGRIAHREQEELRELQRRHEDKYAKVTPHHDYPPQPIQNPHNVTHNESYQPHLRYAYGYNIPEDSDVASQSARDRRQGQVVGSVVGGTLGALTGGATGAYLEYRRRKQPIEQKSITLGGSSDPNVIEDVSRLLGEMSLDEAVESARRRATQNRQMERIYIDEEYGREQFRSSDTVGRHYSSNAQHWETVLAVLRGMQNEQRFIETGQKHLQVGQKAFVDRTNQIRDTIHGLAEVMESYAHVLDDVPTVSPAVIRELQQHARSVSQIREYTHDSLEEAVEHTTNYMDICPELSANTIRELLHPMHLVLLQNRLDRARELLLISEGIGRSGGYTPAFLETLRQELNRGTEMDAGTLLIMCDWLDEDDAEQLAAALRGRVERMGNSPMSQMELQTLVRRIVGM